MLTLTPHTLVQAAHEAGLDPCGIVVAPVSDGGDAVALDAERYVYPASMIKVPLAAAALNDLAAGRLRDDATFPVMPENMTANDASSPLVPGYRASLHQLIELAIANSDNVATNMLFDVVGRERATEIARERFGLARTAFHRKLSGSEPLIDDPQWDGVHRNAHSAADAARMFTLIATNAVPHAPVLRAALARQRWNNKLSEGLGAGDRFEHKTGDTDEVTHDGGILTTAQGRSYTIVVYAALPSTDANNARFGTFMRTLRPHL